jgi:competence protein ComEC
MVLSQIFFFLDRKKWGKILKLVLLITLIWGYATVTGFSPSVLRAATMFSFIYAGKSFRRNISIYNMLAASAFLLLLFEPRLLVQLGFQLSYLAVLGIVLLFKPIHGLLPVNNKIGDKIWQLTSVSIAATTTTFPLSLFYFHQFPNLFWVTNLVAIPAAFLIVYLGMAVLLFSFLPFVSTVLGKVLNLILYGLNRSVGLVESLSFATTRDVFLAPTEFLILMGFVFTVIAVVVLRKRRYMYTSIFLLILLLSLTGIRKAENHIQKKLIVYNVPGHSAYEFVWGTQSVFLGDSLLLRDSSKIDYATNGFRIRYGIKETEMVPLDSNTVDRPCLRFETGLIFFGDRTLFIPRDPIDLQAIKILHRVDLAILSGQYKGDFTLEPDSETIQNWVFDSSVPPWKSQSWKDSLDSWEYSYYDIKTSGAFVYTLE